MSAFGPRIDIPLGEVVLREVLLDFKSPRGYDFLHGHAEILGCTFHAQFVRVKDKPLDPEEDDVVEPFDDAHCVVLDIFEGFMALDDGCWRTVRVPGVPGRFVLVLSPYQH